MVVMVTCWPVVSVICTVTPWPGARMREKIRYYIYKLPGKNNPLEYERVYLPLH